MPAGTGPGLNGAPNGPNTGPLLSGSAQTGATASGDQGTRSGNSDNRGEVPSSPTRGREDWVKCPAARPASTPGLGNQGLAAGGTAALPTTGGNGGGPRSGASLPGSLLSQSDGVGGGTPGALPTASSAPRVGVPTSSMPSGNSFAGGAVPSGETPSLNSSGGPGNPNQGDLPPSILPPSGAGSAENAGASADNLAVGRPTPGAGSADASDETRPARAGQSSSDPQLFGSTGFGATTQGVTPPSGSGSAGTGEPGTADGQSSDPSSSQPPSSSQAKPAEGGGMPSSVHHHQVPLTAKRVPRAFERCALQCESRGRRAEFHSEGG